MRSAGLLRLRLRDAAALGPPRGSLLALRVPVPVLLAAGRFCVRLHDAAALGPPRGSLLALRFPVPVLLAGGRFCVRLRDAAALGSPCGSLLPWRLRDAAALAPPCASLRALRSRDESCALLNVGADFVWLLGVLSLSNRSEGSKGLLAREDTGGIVRTTGARGSCLSELWRDAATVPAADTRRDGETVLAVDTWRDAATVPAADTRRDGETFAWFSGLLRDEARASRALADCSVRS
jgi:hypothetical protein